jgi:hypothetical protein
MLDIRVIQTKNVFACVTRVFTLLPPLQQHKKWLVCCKLYIFQIWIWTPLFKKKLMGV